MKRLRFNHVIIIVLVALSVTVLILQQLIFHDMHESGFLFFQDLMFLPIHILLVTFVLDRILYSREKRERLEQMNIIIGAFFSEVGVNALRVLNPYIAQMDDIRAMLDMTPNWKDRTFNDTAAAIQRRAFDVRSGAMPVGGLKAKLTPMRPYIVQMFSNPGLLEHDTFADMLWALYHLIDEIDSRSNDADLPEADIEHIGGDIIRAYGRLVYEWVLYMKHLKARYPYLWSLAVRKNPFADHTITIQ
jgi:hypothetical protein